MGVLQGVDDPEVEDPAAARGEGGLILAFALTGVRPVAGGPPSGLLRLPLAAWDPRTGVSGIAWFEEGSR
jgi:hypothetical protein